MTKFQNAKRIQESALSRIEKRTLIWLAQHTPRWINSDHLTALGLLAMLGVAVGYWLASRQLVAGLSIATVCLALNWLGDSLDGTLARVRNKLRPRYGFYVDHVVDMLGATFLLAGLALSGFMSLPVAAGLLVVFLILSGNSYLATYTMGVFRISFGAFSPTELRIALAIGNVALYWKTHATLFGREFLLFDIGGVIGIVGMTALLLLSIAQNTTQLYREEPIP